MCTLSVFPVSVSPALRCLSSYTSRFRLKDTAPLWILALTQKLRITPHRCIIGINNSQDLFKPQQMQMCVWKIRHGETEVSWVDLSWPNQPDRLQTLLARTVSGTLICHTNRQSKELSQKSWLFIKYPSPTSLPHDKHTVLPLFFLSIDAYFIENFWALPSESRRLLSADRLPITRHYDLHCQNIAPPDLLHVYLFLLR